MTRAEQIAALEQIVADTRTVGSDYGIPHVAILAARVLDSLRADTAELRAALVPIVQRAALYPSSVRDLQLEGVLRIWDRVGGEP